MTPEQVVNCRKWTAALRSGEYQQARGRLHYNTLAGVPSFCCLGVACDLTKSGEWTPGGAYRIGEHLVRGLEIPDVIVADEYGIGFLDQQHLAHLNDNGATFAAIADHIDLLVAAQVGGAE